MILRQKVITAYMYIYLKKKHCSFQAHMTLANSSIKAVDKIYICEYLSGKKVKDCTYSTAFLLDQEGIKLLNFFFSTKNLQNNRIK